ncbi:MAG: 6-pyruvoyl-tetrahydropterin synthase-related protein [Deltaproteobacteria bacterium]
MIVGMVGLSICLPLWRVYWYDSHEMGRYLVRLFEYVRGLRDGQRYPRWAPDLYGGYGTALLEFFPPFVLMLAAIPNLFGADPALALKIAIGLLSVAGATGAFLLGRAETGRDDAGLLTAVAFVFAPYRFVDLYLRGDLSEYGALCLMPVALWLYRELWRAPRGKRALLGCLAAVAQAAVILSHTIIGQWGTELLALAGLVSLWPAIRAADWRRVAAGFAPLLFGLGLCAIYLLPAILEKSATHMSQVTAGYYQSTAHLVPFERFFYFDFYAFVSDGFTFSHNRMPFSIGLPAAIGIDLALAGFLFDRRRTARAAGWALAALGVLLLMTPSAAGLWRILPLGSYVQFPWRLLAFVATLGAVAFGAAFAAVAPKGPTALALAAFISAAIAWDGQRFVVTGHEHHGELAQADPGMSSASIQRRAGSALTGAGEYLPAGPAEPPRAPRASLILPNDETMKSVVGEQLTGTTYRIHLDATGPGSADLQTFWFPGWRISRQSGPASVAIVESPRSLVRLVVPSSGSYELSVELGDTLPRTLGLLASLLSLALLWPVLRWMNLERGAPHRETRT